MRDRFDELEAQLVLITGPMFSGKTTELVSLLRRYEIAGYTVLLVKPSIENRYSESEVVSHDGFKMSSIKLPLEGSKTALEELLKNKKYDVIGVDEVQFFGLEFARYLVALSYRIPVYVAGLNLDFRGEPWDSVKELMPYADEIRNRYAICMYRDPETGKICGKPATRTQRLINGKPAPYDSPRIVIGGKETYEPRCKEHHVVPGKPREYF